MLFVLEYLELCNLQQQKIWNSTKLDCRIPTGSSEKAFHTVDFDVQTEIYIYIYLRIETF
jgi:hypothetical protein